MSNFFFAKKKKKKILKTFTHNMTVRERLDKSPRECR
jgi:hypothetical protein